MSSSERFGYEWHRYDSVEPYATHYKQQFWNWMAPHEKDYIQGKSVLDAGCGMGRNSYWASKAGAASVAAFDLDERSIAAAKRTLADQPKATVEQQTIYTLPWREKFDLVFSIGVVHHLDDPKAAVAELAKTLIPGGELHLWVYSEVGYKKILPLLNCVRRITSRVPLPLAHAVTYFASIPFYYVYLPFLRPKRQYFDELHSYSFSHVHSILFDQLIPTIAHYYTKEQARELLSGLEDVEVFAPPNGNGWVVHGRKPT